MAFLICWLPLTTEVDIVESLKQYRSEHLSRVWYAVEIFPLQSHSPPPPVCHREVLPAVINLL